MTKDLEARLQAALDEGAIPADLAAEVNDAPELSALRDIDGALRSMPSFDLGEDFSEAVVGRLDEELDEIPGLFDAPAFDEDMAAPASFAPPPPIAEEPISLDERRRRRSAAPFMISAAAVVGLVAAGTLMTLSRDAAEPMAASTIGGLNEEVAAPAPAAEMPAEMAAPSSSAPELALDEAEEEDGEVLAGADRGLFDGLGRTGGAEANAEASAEPRRRARRRPRMSARGSSNASGAFASWAQEEVEAEAEPAAEPAAAPAAPASPTSGLTARQRRTYDRVLSCLPHDIRVTRVRGSSDGERILGIETSRELTEEQDECVAGVIDRFPRARRRSRRRAPSSMISAID